MGITLKPATSRLKKQNIFSKLVGEIGPVRSDLLKMGMNGQIAILCDDGDYYTYDANTCTLTNVLDFAMDVKGLFYRMPTADLAAGDLILVGGAPYYVAEVDPAGISALNVQSRKVEVLANTTTLIGKPMWTKIVSIANMFGGTAGAGAMNPMLMMALMGDGGLEGFGGGSDLSQFIMLQAMSGQGGATNFMANPMMMMAMMGGDNGGGGLFGGGGGLKDIMMLNMLSGQGGANPFGNLFGAAPAAPTQAPTA